MDATNPYKLEKFSKALVNVAPNDNGFSTVIGDTPEIVPVTNPATIKPGVGRTEGREPLTRWGARAAPDNGCSLAHAPLSFLRSIPRLVSHAGVAGSVCYAPAQGSVLHRRRLSRPDQLDVTSSAPRGP